MHSELCEYKGMEGNDLLFIILFTLCMASSIEHRYMNYIKYTCKLTYALCEFKGVEGYRSLLFYYTRDQWRHHRSSLTLKPGLFS